MTLEEYAKDQLSYDNFTALRKEFPQAFVETEMLEIFPRCTTPAFRSKHLLPFLTSHLSKNVVDLCVGSGSLAVVLRDAGHYVIGNEYDPKLRELARRTFPHVFTDENSTQGIPIYNMDWREGIPRLNRPCTYLCTGNAFDYLHRDYEQDLALINIRDAMDVGDRLIIDQRNFDAIIRGEFKLKGLMYDPAEYIPSFPWISADKNAIVLQANDQRKILEPGYLVLHPFQGAELEAKLGHFFGAAPDRLQKFYDFVPEKKATPKLKDECEFITYIVTKR